MWFAHHHFCIVPILPKAIQMYQEWKCKLALGQHHISLQFDIIRWWCTTQPSSLFFWTSSKFFMHKAFYFQNWSCLYLQGERILRNFYFIILMHVPCIFILSVLQPTKAQTFVTIFFLYIVFTPTYFGGTRWRSGWGTVLQTARSRDRFPMASSEFFIDITLPVTLWPWGRLSL
jgi:hypothetical protein